MAKRKHKPASLTPVYAAYLKARGLPPDLLLSATEAKSIWDGIAKIPCPKETVHDVLLMAGEVKRRWPLYVAANRGVVHAIHGLVKQWSHYEIIRTPSEKNSQILSEHVRAWWMKNKACLRGLESPEEVRRLFLHVEGRRLRDGEWRNSPDFIAYARLEYDRLDTFCDLRPEMMLPRIAAALALLGARGDSDG